MPSVTASPGTIVNDNSFGSISWNNPTNAASANGSYAEFAGQTSNYLKCTNFSFSVPDGATVDGITVEYRAVSNGASDARVRLVKGGTIQTTDRSDPGIWPDFAEYLPRGGEADLWGDTWSAEDINDSGFGVAIAGSGGFFISGMIDHVRITVHYTAEAADPPTLTSIDPTSGSTEGGTAVTLTGTDFVEGATVTFGGQAATDVIVASDTSITCVTPAHAAGAVDVVVTNDDEQSDTLEGAYTYVEPAASMRTPRVRLGIGLGL